MIRIKIKPIKFPDNFETLIKRALDKSMKDIAEKAKTKAMANWLGIEEEKCQKRTLH